MRVAPDVDGVYLDCRLQDAVRELLLRRRTGDDDDRVWAGLGGLLIRILVAARRVQRIQQRDPAGTRLVDRQVDRDKRWEGRQFGGAQLPNDLSTEFEIAARIVDHAASVLGSR